MGAVCSSSMGRAHAQLSSVFRYDKWVRLRIRTRVKVRARVSNAENPGVRGRALRHVQG